MGLFDLLFDRIPCPEQHKQEANKLITDLLKIGATDGYLSERPAPPFNAQCRHTRAREIGKRLSELGGFALMEYAYRRVKRKLGSALAAHLEYAWSEIGNWMP